MSTELVHVPFYGGEILALKSEHGEHVVLKPLCESLGIDEEAQRKRMLRAAWARGCTSLMEVVLPGSQGARRVFTLNRKRIAMWLATLDTERVREEVRPRLELLQNEAADVLDAYFMGKGAPDPRDALIADLRRQLSTARPASTLRPTDIAAAWARAHLEASKEPLPLREAWARYVVWSQEKGLPMPLHLSTLSSGVAAMFHQVRQPGRVAYYCAFRAEPLPVELPQERQPRATQQSLPLAAAPQHDAAELADRALRLLSRNELPAFAVAEILGITEVEAAAVLGPLAEASGVRAKVRAGKVFYSVDLSAKSGAESGAELRDRVELAVHGKAETTLAEVAQALGLDPTMRAVALRIGLALRDIGYEKYRSSTDGRPYIWHKAQVN